MASQQSVVDYVCEQMAGGGEISSRRMFGEYGIYCDATFIGVICRDALFLKITKAGEAFAADLERASPYDGARPSFLISQDRIEDRDWLAAMVRVTRDDLPRKK